jgi:hypothetical protein
MAALMIVLVVPVFMNMLVAVGASLVRMFPPVMAVGTALVAMLMLMLILVVAAHRNIVSFFLTSLKLSIDLLAVNGGSAP